MARIERPRRMLVVFGAAPWWNLKNFLVFLKTANIYNFISPFLVEERKKTNNHTINNKKAA